MRRIVMLLGLCLLLATAAYAQETPITQLATAPTAANVQLQPFITELRRPLYITHSGDESGRLFILEQGGVIYVTNSTGTDLAIFLDVSPLVSAEANGSSYIERGLLGLAFHPQYAQNGLFFINYTDRQGATVIARYRVSSQNANQADINSAQIIFTHPQPFPNHNGGHMAFGPDGYLYVSLGDGGAANDPLGAGQNLEILLGKILRLDVNANTGYAIPPDNPLVGTAGADEIWAYGLRNVWRFSFDRATGDMYLGDVGQNAWEEINFQPAASPGGENYGWNAYEASRVFNNRLTVDNAVMPIAEYEHTGANGCSVTGGYVYRGEALPELQGAYLYSDYCSGRIWVAYRDTSDTWQSSVFLDSGLQVSSFGEDDNGELFIVDYGGAVFRLIAAG
jgi:glucose/arabinose dehydrogenase